ncbi:unnamed protein product [Candida verbasci]|uniref:protein-tyrosine-phosphatase n=1 Tax=Candida verbasci TaxID=1227364 RepID=A0A9W4TSZ3_9ASCO|nr:unnamed protein product [Candida verbasci]
MIYRILGVLYLSSIKPIIEELDLAKEYKITHILSILPGSINETYFSNYTWKQIEITDEETTNIIPYLEDCITFIDSAFINENPGNVLVHCAQGVSRSVIVIMAYLMKRYKLTLDQSLYAVKRKCSDAEPNSSFIKQLEMFANMGFKLDESNEEYKRFLINISMKLDPTGKQVRDLIMERQTNDESKDMNSNFELRCKRCRQILANQSNMETHEIPTQESKQSKFTKTAPNSRRIISIQNASNKCSHYFLKEPVKWMQSELEKSQLEGKFQCPKCGSKVGGYNWQGSRCSCGKWMVPATHLQEAKVDFFKK